VEVLAAEQEAVQQDEDDRSHRGERHIGDERHRVRQEHGAEGARGVLKGLGPGERTRGGQAGVVAVLDGLGHLLEEEGGHRGGDGDHQHHRDDEEDRHGGPAGEVVEPGDLAHEGQGERVGERPGQQPQEQRGAGR
jgi:hypothetical protein